MRDDNDQGIKTDDFDFGQENDQEESDKSTSTGSKGGRSKGRQGFASMDEKKQREIASKGGQAAHRAGTAHEFTSEEAREAGRKGGRS